VCAFQQHTFHSSTLSLRVPDSNRGLGLMRPARWTIFSNSQNLIAYLSAHYTWDCSAFRVAFNNWCPLSRAFTFYYLGIHILKGIILFIRFSKPKKQSHLHDFVNLTALIVFPDSNMKVYIDLHKCNFCILYNHLIINKNNLHKGNRM
jgi:hypothetical protein